MKLIKLSEYSRLIYLLWSDPQKRKAIIRWLKINFYRRFPSNTSEERKKLHRELIHDSSWSTDFILCTIISCLIASFGLLSNSSAVIIGAMLVAPLMLPLRGLAFSACERDFKLFKTALYAIAGATILSLILSGIIARIVSFTDLGSEIIARTQPNLIDLGIAVSAGAMSGFGKIRKGISDTLAGTAIAVALMPPLCVVGICLVMGNYPFAWGAFLLYITNLLGITLACMIVFIFSGYTKMNHALGWTGLLTLLLLIPLGASFFRLLDQQKVEKEITDRLKNETVTIGTDVESVMVSVVWTTKRPVVYVTLQTDKEITNRQVNLTEKYLNRRLNRNFQLILYVSPLTRITGELEEQTNPEEVTPQIITNDDNNQLPNQLNKPEEDSDVVDFLPQYPSPQ